MSNPYTIRNDFRVRGDATVDGDLSTSGTVSAPVAGVVGAGYLAASGVVAFDDDTPTDIALYTVPAGHEGYVDWVEVVVLEEFDGTGAALTVESSDGTNNGLINLTDISGTGPQPSDASGLGADLWSSGNTAPARLGLAAGDVIRYTLTPGSGASTGQLLIRVHGAVLATP